MSRTILALLALIVAAADSLEDFKVKSCTTTWPEDGGNSIDDAASTECEIVVKGRTASSILEALGADSTGWMAKGNRDSGGGTGGGAEGESSPSPPPAPCDIDGFETFCEHWTACTTPPASAMLSDDGQRCLYSRLNTFDPTKTLLEQNVDYPFHKVTFLAGPDHVAKLAKWHCTADGRGEATLGCGFLNPPTGDGYWTVVFAAPCPNSKWQVPLPHVKTSHPPAATTYTHPSSRTLAGPVWRAS